MFNIFENLGKYIETMHLVLPHEFYTKNMSPYPCPVPVCGFGGAPLLLLALSLGFLRSTFQEASRRVVLSILAFLASFFYPSTSHNFRSLIYKYFLHLVRHKKWMLSHIHLGLPLKCLLYSLLLSDGFLLCSSPSGIQQDVCTFILVLARCLHFKQFYEEEWVLFILLLLFMAQWLTYG